MAYANQSGQLQAEPDPSMQQPQLMGVQMPMQQAAPTPGQYVNPALAASVLGLQGQQSQQGAIDRQRKMADMMRGDAQSQLQGQQAGRIYKAPGIANLAASLVNSYGASQMGKRADTATGAMDKQKQSAMQDYFAALTGGTTPPPMSQSPDMP